jgi:hypothetical protein
MKKQCISSDEAPRSTVQHKRPCTDCPFARTALRGWLGELTREEWVEVLHGEERVLCHAILGPECAGAAIYRSNVCKMPRDVTLLKLPADRQLVFASPGEFVRHHEVREVRPSEEVERSDELEVSE